MTQPLDDTRDRDGRHEAATWPADMDAGQPDDGAEDALALAARLEHVAGHGEISSARAEVVAARAALVAERARLEASARAALDIPARVRRAPAKTAGIAAAGAFLLFGGPGRVFRGLRRAVLGPRADLPKSMLPDEVEKQLRKLGDDGDRVRAILEREFVRYLDERADLRRERDLVGTLVSLAGNLLRPASLLAGRRLLEQAFDPDNRRSAARRRGRGQGGARRGSSVSPGFSEAIRRARERADRQGPGDQRRSRSS